MRRSRFVSGMATLFLLVSFGGIVKSNPLGVGSGAQDSPVPVVLVHGWCSDPAGAFGTVGNGTSFGELLARDGFVVAYANYSETTCLEPGCIEPIACLGCNGLTIDLLAGRLASQLDLIRERLRVSQVDIVSHSMGGLVARTYIAGMARRAGQLVPYRGEIRRLVMAGTPNFGSVEAGFALLPPGCSQVQARQIKIGSTFIRDLQHVWEALPQTPDTLVIAGTKGTVFPSGDPVDDQDGVVSIYSAALAESPDERVRYVPYKHTADIPYPINTPSLVRPDGPQHATLRLASAFLKSGAVLPQCCGQGTVDYQPQTEALGRSLVLIQILLQNGDPASGLFGLGPKFTPAAEWDSRSENQDNATIGLVGFRPGGLYALTVEDLFRRGSVTGVSVQNARTTLSVVQIFPR